MLHQSKDNGEYLLVHFSWLKVQEWDMVIYSCCSDYKRNEANVVHLVLRLCESKCFEVVMCSIVIDDVLRLF